VAEKKTLRYGKNVSYERETFVSLEIDNPQPSH
jgi:hypothetical protein